MGNPGIVPFADHEPVAFLHVLSRDVVVLMDMSAGGQVRVSVTPHRPVQTGFFAAQGRFADGTQLDRVTRTGPTVTGDAHYRYSVATTGTGLSLDVSPLSVGEAVGGCR
jgi:hypothetical protein